MSTIPLFNARIEHLTHAEMIEVECLECGHQGEVSVIEIRSKIPAWFRVLDVPRVLRCDQCGAAGRASINARSALGYDKLN
jgi:uncharacterized Zn finger protein